MNTTEVIYNADCPVCRFEIDHYKAYSDTNGLALRFLDLRAGSLAAHGLSEDDAARRLHVIRDGVVLSGVPAFAALWSEMPRYAWLSKLVMWPVVRPVAAMLYDKVAAPILYRAHLKRRARAANA